MQDATLEVHCRVDDGSNECAPSRLMCISCMDTEHLPVVAAAVQLRFNGGSTVVRSRTAVVTTT